MPRQNRIILILVVVLVSFLFLAGIAGKAFTQNTEPSISNSQTIFQPIIPELTKSGVPLRLPTYIPSRGQRLNNEGTPPDAVYSNIDRLSDGQYLVTLGYTQDCTAGAACRLGTIEGDRKTAQTPPIEEVYSFMRDPNFKGTRSKEEMSQVDLVQNHQGWFIPWICGANCNDAKVVWDEDSYRYVMGIKLGDKNSLVEMANSAINNRS